MADILHSAHPDGPRVSTAALDVVARQHRSLLSAAPGAERARSASAAVIALSRRARMAEATALADAELERVDDASAPEELVGLLLAASEAHATAGHIRRAGALASTAASYAELVDDEVLRFRSLGHLGCAQALAGDVAAPTSLADARSIQRAHGWTTGSAAFGLLLGELVEAARALDVPALAEIEREARAHDSDVLWRSCAALARCLRLLIGGDTTATVTVLPSILAGAEERGAMLLVREMTAHVLAAGLILRGEVRRALGVLQGLPVSGGAEHALCLAAPRAAAHLHLGENGQALAATDECMRMGAHHAAPALRSVLVCRSVAYERLGLTRLADDRFEEAVRMPGPGLTADLLLLPQAERAVLVERYRTRRPGPSRSLDDAIDQLAELPAVETGRFVLPALTEGEANLARSLRSSDSLREIAARSHVSVNTLKSHARSLYAKLSVSSRDDAVRALEDAGFFDSPPW